MGKKGKKKGDGGGQPSEPKPQQQPKQQAAGPSQQSAGPSQQAAGPSQPQKQQKKQKGQRQDSASGKKKGGDEQKPQQQPPKKGGEEQKPQQQPKQQAAGPSQPQEPQQKKQKGQQKAQRQDSASGSTQEPRPDQREQQSQPGSQHISQIQSGIQQMAVSGQGQQSGPGRQPGGDKPQKQTGKQQKSQPQPTQQPSGQQQWGPGTKQPQQQTKKDWGPGGNQEAWQQKHQPVQQPSGQQQRGAGTQQQQWGAGTQQQQQTKKDWGPGGNQGAWQQQTQPTQQPSGQQQQWGPRGGQHQQQPGIAPGSTQQQPWHQKSQPTQQPSGQQQQQWGPQGGQHPQQQQQHPQQQGTAPGSTQQQPWQQKSQPTQQPSGQQQQQWGPQGGQHPQQQHPQQQHPQQQGIAPGSTQQQPWQQKSQPTQQPSGQQQQQWGPRGGQHQQQPGIAPGSTQQQPWQQKSQPTQPDQGSRPPSQQSSRSSQPDQGSRPPSQQSSRGGGPPQKSSSGETPTAKKVGGIQADYCVRSSPLKNGHKWQGTVGEKHAIEVNYMKLNLEKIPKTAYQYRVDFSLERPTRFRPAAFDQFRQTVLSGNRRPGFPIAFDGKNIAFAAVKVPNDKLNVAHSVKFVDVETNVAKELSITMKEADYPVVELTALFNYHETGITDQPLRALQCIDVVLRSAPTARAKVFGRAFYVPPAAGQAVDLGDLFVLWRGLHQSVVLGDYPMINIDVAHRAFLDNANLVDAYNRLGRDASQFLRGLNIIYNPPPAMNSACKLYKVNDLVEPPSRKRFKDQDGREWTVKEYFESKNVQLQRPDLPCVSVGTVKQACLPLEFCFIQGGQDVRRKAGPNQTRALIKCAATPTTIRKKNIMAIFSNFEYNNNEIIRGFGLSLTPEFIKIIARNIPPPTLQYSDGNARPQKGSWRSTKFLESAPLHKWGVFVTARVDDGDLREFIESVRREARRCNMNIDNDNELIVEPDQRANPFANLEKFKKKGCSIVFVIISGFNDSYSKIKQTAEIQLKMLTQCIKTNTIRRMNASTISNIFLKVNSKLNGINHKLQPAPILKPLMTDVPIMFLGADVTHPSPDQLNIPSIVGVVASHDQLAFQYNVCWRLQDPREEMISDMESIVLEQLHFFNRQRKTYPQHIIYYRDGVSNGQFPQLQQIELSGIDRACARVNIKYKPAITCLVVQKRHHTRFFPPVPSKIVHPNDRNQNVLPGTVVDTVITHPGEKQFFLVSHESIQGTAKPSKYCIIRDDANFQPDQLQAITYALCHMFTRCNRAVSYPAPAYYAHLMAARGRVYIEGARLNIKNLAREYSTRNVDDIRQRHPMYFV